MIIELIIQHFSENTEGLSVEFSTDGVNPLGRDQTYSFWPLVLAVQNLPPEIRKSAVGFLIGGIAPGNGTKEPAIQPYLDALADEVVSLKRAEIFNDAYMEKPVELDVRVRDIVGDTPGLAKVTLFVYLNNFFRSQ